MSSSSPIGLIEESCSLKGVYQSFKEDQFTDYKNVINQRLIDNFLDMALAGISSAFFLRIMVLESKNALLDLILPFTILAFISFIYLVNKQSK